MVKRVLIPDIFLTVVFALISYYVWNGLWSAGSSAIGSFIGALNFFAISYVGRGLLGEGGGKLRFALLGVLKFLLLVAILWVAIKFVKVEPWPFLLGLSTIIIALPIGYARI